MPSNLQLSSPEHMDHFKVTRFEFAKTSLNINEPFACDLLQVTSTEQLFEMVRMHLPPHEFDVQNGGIYAKTTLYLGFKFAFCAISWTKEPLNKNVAWEVSDFCFRIF